MTEKHSYLAQVGNDDFHIPPEYLFQNARQEKKRGESNENHHDVSRCVKCPETIEDNNTAPVPAPELKYGHSSALSSPPGESTKLPQSSRKSKTAAPDSNVIYQSPLAVQVMNIQTSDHSSLSYNIYSAKSRRSSINNLDVTEEGLAIACPVDESENNKPIIYAATKYDPSPKKSFYKSLKCRVYTALTVLVITMTVVGVVWGTNKRLVIEENFLNNQTSEIEKMIEARVLERKARFRQMNSTDPRYLALIWILHEDGQQLSLNNSNLLQRYTLALLAYSLDFYSWNCGMVFDLISCHETNVDEYALWLSAADECLWYGVRCISGVVQSISLPSNNLIGTIPPEIRQLQSLESLLLSHNCIYGTIPQEIWGLTNLSEIDFEMNLMSGVIQSELYELSSLIRLKVAGNKIDEFSCNQRGSEVNISSPGLAGEIFNPAIAHLYNLQEISISGNSFNGSISSAIGRLHRLELISAYSNMLSGSLPNEISNLSSLRELKLAQNKITGSIPDRIGDMSSLESLYLWGMAMSGTIPHSLYSLANLKKLHLGKNDPGFRGPIDSEVGTLLQLREFVVNDNPLLTGMLPTELGLCQELRILKIQHTQVTGNVPKELCALAESRNLEYPWASFEADCSTGNETLFPVIECNCCSVCCDHTTKECVFTLY